MTTPLCELSELHPFPWDHDTSFDEAKHEYTLVKTGTKFPKSVTSLVRQALPSNFDARVVIEAGLGKWASDPSSKYYSLIRYLQLVKKMTLTEVGVEIKALWSAEGLQARKLGTEMHAELEDWMNGKHTGVGSHVYAINMVTDALNTAFFPTMQLTPFRTELRVFLTTTVCHPSAPHDLREIPVLSGTIDALFRDHIGRLWIVDWKRSDTLKKGLLALPKTSRFDKRGVNHFSEFTESTFLSYSLQLVFYKLMLERGGYLSIGTGFPSEVAGLFLCQLHPSMQKAHFVEAMHGMSEVCQERFENAASALLDDHIMDCKAKELVKIQRQMDAETSDEDEDGEHDVEMRG